MADKVSQSLAHMVFFSLKDRSEAVQDSLVNSCRKFLDGHPGADYFAVGRRAEACQREVNDTEHDVALIIVFASEADHDRYQVSERHQQFIAENQASWAKVRVFDALV